MSPSSLIFRPSGEPHSDRFHATTRCFNIQMSEEWLSRLAGRANLINTPVDFQGGRSARLAALLYREFREVDEFSSLAIEGLVLEIVAEVSRRSVKESDRKPPRWLEQVRAILCEQLSRNFSLVGLAESVDVHPAHLAREFRRFYRCTTGEYVRQRRIEFICRQISASDAP